MNQNSKNLRNGNESIGSFNEMDKAKSLIKIIEEDLYACEFEWSLFVAAANNYKYDSLLRPFPSAYVVNKILDINCLRERIANIPDFCVLLKQLRHFCDHPNTSDNCINHETIDLLYSCMISTRDEPILKSVNRSNFDSVLRKVNSVVPGPRPDHIFEVKSPADSIAEEKFRGHQKNCSTTFGYHGSKLESFHSILNYGLQQHLCKAALYGEGIYLSSEPHVSLMFSPTSYGSSCVAICEFVQHPTYLKCHTKEKSNQTGVPDKYFVITNNEIVRVRYLIVYGSVMIKPMNYSLAQCGVTENKILMWTYRHKWITAMIAYAFMLLIIGASNSRHGYFMRQYMRQATTDVIHYLKTLGFNYIQKFFN